MRIQKDSVSIVWINTENKIADTFTKQMTYKRYNNLTSEWIAQVYYTHFYFYNNDPFLK